VLRAAGERWDVRLVLEPVDAAPPVLPEPESSTLQGTLNVPVGSCNLARRTWSSRRSSS
jgi:hypothetical protein